MSRAPQEGLEQGKNRATELGGSGGGEAWKAAVANGLHVMLFQHIQHIEILCDFMLTVNR